MTELSREEIKDFARSEFESAMAFGVSLDNFVRLGMRCCKYGAESERERVVTLEAELRQSLLQERKECDRADAERAVSDRLLEALKTAEEIIGRFFSDDGWTQADMDTWDNHSAVIAEVEAMRKEKPE